MLCVQCSSVTVMCCAVNSHHLTSGLSKQAQAQWGRGKSVLMDEISEFGRINPLFYFLLVALDQLGIELILVDVSFSQ